MSRVTREIKRRHVDAVPGSFLPDQHPVLRRIYAARQSPATTDLQLSLNQLLPFRDLSGIESAVALLESALREQKHILIVADFDADGATSCAIAVRILRAFGASRVSYVVPNRFEYGYGLTPEIVELAAAQAPDLLVTVDNGISSIDGVAAARARGIQVLVTDHHLPGPMLPQADAIVNPNVAGDGFASKNLAGCGVIFYVMMALRVQLRNSGWFAARGVAEPNIAQHLDIVALGTVADVVPLDYNNRILVRQGLQRIRSGQACPGIAALLRVAERSPQRLAASDLAFAVAPRLNAAGRLSDMSLGIECLLADNAVTALQIAQRLDVLNRERRDIESQMQEQAFDFLQTLAGRADAADARAGICLFDPEWHQGVIGILAGRVKEHLHRPTIAFAPSGDDELKGSARSVPGIHIRDVLDSVAARNPGLMSKFGGHAMAAGVTLPRANYDQFADAFAREVAANWDDDADYSVVWTDGELSADQFDLPLAQAIRDGGPWGQAFPEPMFDGVVDVIDQRVVGEKHLKLTIRLGASDKPIDAIAFNAIASWSGEVLQRLRIAYRLDINEFRGAAKPQALIEYFEAV